MIINIKLCAWWQNMSPPLSYPQWAPKRLTPPSRPKHSSTLPRWLLQLHDALTRRWAKRPGDLELLTLKVVSESRVMWATPVPILFFLGLSVLNLGPMYATDVRQTEVRCQTDRHQTKASLNAHLLGGGGIINDQEVINRRRIIINDNDNDKRLGLTAKADQPDHKNTVH